MGRWDKPIGFSHNHRFIALYTITALAIVFAGSKSGQTFLTKLDRLILKSNIYVTQLDYCVPSVTALAVTLLDLIGLFNIDPKVEQYE